MLGEADGCSIGEVVGFLLGEVDGCEKLFEMFYLCSARKHDNIVKYILTLSVGAFVGLLVGSRDGAFKGLSVGCVKRKNITEISRQ